MKRHEKTERTQLGLPQGGFWKWAMEVSSNDTKQGLRERVRTESWIHIDVLDLSERQGVRRVLSI